MKLRDDVLKVAALLSKWQKAGFTGNVTIHFDQASNIKKIQVEQVFQVSDLQLLPEQCPNQTSQTTCPQNPKGSKDH